MEEIEEQRVTRRVEMFVDRNEVLPTDEIIDRVHVAREVEELIINYRPAVEPAEPVVEREDSLLVQSIDRAIKQMIDKQSLEFFERCKKRIDDITIEKIFETIDEGYTYIELISSEEMNRLKAEHQTQLHNYLKNKLVELRLHDFVSTGFGGIHGGFSITSAGKLAQMYNDNHYSSRVWIHKPVQVEDSLLLKQFHELRTRNQELEQKVERLTKMMEQVYYAPPGSGMPGYYESLSEYERSVEEMKSGVAE
jgi:hypothetical protein